MAGAGRAGDHPGRDPSDVAGAGRAGDRPRRDPSDRPAGTGTHAVIAYLRANPQVFVLVVICIVLGFGTFLAVVLGLLTAGSGQTTGEPSGAVMRAYALIAGTHALITGFAIAGGAQPFHDLVTNLTASSAAKKVAAGSPSTSA